MGSAGIFPSIYLAELTNTFEGCGGGGPNLVVNLSFPHCLGMQHHLNGLV